MRDFDKAIELNQNERSAYLARGFINIIRDHAEDGIKDMTKAIDIDPNCLSAYIGQGISKSKSGDSDGALASFNQALAIEPENPRALMNRGKVKVDKKDIDGGLSDINAALKIYPSYIAAYVNRAIAFGMLGKKKEADTDLTRALDYAKSKPLKQVIYLDRAANRFDMNNIQGGFQDIDKAISLNPDDSDAYAARAASKIKIGKAATAMSDVDKALMLNPECGSAYLARGGIKADQHDITGALADYEKAIKYSPKNPNIYINQAIAYQNMRQPVKAEESCNIALSLKPAPDAASMAHFIKGASMELKGDFPAAVSEYTDSVALNDRNGIVFFKLGFAKSSIKDVEGAMDAYTKAISINPNNTKALNARAVLKQEQKNLSGAMEDIMLSVKIDPKNGDTYFYRGCIKQDMQDLDGEIADFRMASSLNPNQPAFQDALSKALSSKNANATVAQAMYYQPASEVDELMKTGAAKNAAGDREGALKAFEKVIELNPKAENAIVFIGVISSESGDQQKAIEAFNRALSINDNNYSAYCYRGIAKGRLNDIPGALADLNKSIEINSNNVEAFMNRSITKVNLNDIAGAENDLRKATSIAPSDPRIAQVQTLINSSKPQITTAGQSQSIADKQSQAIALNNIASQKIDSGDAVGAAEYWSKSVNLYPTPDACINLGRLKGMQGSYDEALAYLTQGIRLLQPPDPRPYSLRALVKCHKGDWDGAIRDYTEALKINPSFTEASVMREKAKAHQL